MENPWQNIPREQPFILECDSQLVLDFNNRVNDDHKIHLDLLPEPYLGNPEAEIILLNLNPGYRTDDSWFHSFDDYFVTASRLNLLHGEQEYPFYFLDPEIVKRRGRRWWNKKLGDLIKQFGASTIANHVFCVEFFPYHSKKYKSLRAVLPSQYYSFELVRKAIRRRVFIIVMRSRERWLKAVPELADYHYYELSSPQNAVVTKNNLLGGFDKIVEVLTTV